MANSLASLVVSLGLNAAEYISGLVKAENATKKFGRIANTTYTDIAKLVGSLAIGRELVLATQGAITSAAALNDLSDATGASVESLSRLSNQAAIAGTDFETLQTALLKLSVNMAGADEESSKVNQTLKALGITTKDPAQAFQEIAIALNKYKDGINKAQIAMTLFGKAGPALLASLKDIAELQDVQATVTKKQAEEAENLEKAWRRLAVESTVFKNAVLDNLVPPLLEFITRLNEASKVAGNFFSGLKVAAQIAPWEDTTAAVARLEKELASLEETAKKPGFEIFGMTFAKGASVNILANIETVRKSLEVLRKEQLAAFGGPPTNVQMVKPDAPKLAKTTTGTGANKQVEDAKRYLDALSRTLERTQDLSAAEQLLADIREGRFAGFSDKQLREAQVIAAAIDGNKAQAKAIQEANDKQKEAIRVAERAAEEQKRANESRMEDARQIAQANVALSDEIAFIKGGEEALKQIERTRILNTIATNENTIAQLKLNTAREGEIPGLQAQNAELEKRLGLLKDKDVAIALKADADAMQALADTMSDSFADAFEGFVMGTKSASQAFKDLADDIERYLLKIALHKIGDQMFGGQTSGGGDVFGAIFSKLLGMFSSPAGGGFGTGPYQFAAAGTNFAWGGPTVVGENGPEIVDMPRGARVWPNGTGPQQSAGDSIHMENHFHVQGTINSQTVRQIERGIGDSVARNRIDR